MQRQTPGCRVEWSAPEFGERDQICFSAQADVAAGIVVGAIGVSALRQVHRRRDLPLASLPVLFAGHQLVEALVWLDLTDRVSATSGRVALWLYMLFAYVVIPC